MNIALKKESFTVQQPDRSRQLVDFLRAHYDAVRAGKPMHTQPALIAAVQRFIEEHADPGKRSENLTVISISEKNTFHTNLPRESALDTAIREKDWELVRLMEAVVSRRQA